MILSTPACSSLELKVFDIDAKQLGKKGVSKLYEHLLQYSTLEEIRVSNISDRVLIPASFTSSLLFAVFELPTSPHSVD